VRLVWRPLYGVLCMSLVCCPELSLLTPFEWCAVSGSSRRPSPWPCRVLSFFNRLPLLSRCPFPSVCLVRCCSRAAFFPRTRLAGSRCGRAVFSPSTIVCLSDRSSASPLETSLPLGSPRLLLFACLPYSRAPVSRVVAVTAPCACPSRAFILAGKTGACVPCRPASCWRNSDASCVTSSSTDSPRLRPACRPDFLSPVPVFLSFIRSAAPLGQKLLVYLV
jgi:hypothetical protein